MRRFGRRSILKGIAGIFTLGFFRASPDRTITINGIVCREIAGDDMAGAKQFVCHWADRFAVANGMIGHGSGSTANPPMRHPDHPEMTCNFVSIRPSGIMTGLGFDKAIVRGDFSEKSFDRS